MEDWQVMKEIIAAVRQAIPDASSKPPGAVLEHVLGALQAVEAKIINCSENVPSMHSSPARTRKWGISIPLDPVIRFAPLATRQPIDAASYVEDTGGISSGLSPSHLRK